MCAGHGRSFLAWAALGWATVAVIVALAAAIGAEELGDIRWPRVVPGPWRFGGFPIVAWWGPPGTADRRAFEAYRDAGFTLHATNPDDGFHRALENVEAVGLRSLVFRQPQGFGLPALPNPVLPTDRPAVVGWIVADEPSSPTETERAITAVNGLMREDPTRWAFFNLLPPHLEAESSTEAIVDAAVRAGMPVLSYDTYVTMGDGSDRAERFYHHLDRFRRASLDHRVPFWAFALTIAHPGYRRPSESDLRWQHYSNLAYGAKGLWYFTYWAPTGWPGWDPRAIVDGREGAPTDLYEAVKALNHAVLGMGDLLLRLRSVEVEHTRPPAGQRAFEPGRWWIAEVQAEDALVGFFEDPDGVPHALIVNKRHGPGLRARDADASVVLTFSPRVHAVHALNWLDGATGPLALDAGRASLTIAGGTGVLLRADVGPRGRTEEAWPPAP